MQMWGGTYIHADIDVGGPIVLQMWGGPIVLQIQMWGGYSNADIDVGGVGYSH